MPDSTVRSDVNVEQIMADIRARIREKRGVDYSEQQVRDLAAAKLEKLLEQFRRAKPPAPPPNFTFDERTLFESAPGKIPFLRRLLGPFVRLFVNPAAVAGALHIQSELNARQAQLEASRHMLYDELIHNLVVESARLGLEVKQLKMRVESLASRLEFSERRMRALESAQISRSSAPDPVTAPAIAHAQLPTAAPALAPAAPPALQAAPVSSPPQGLGPTTGGPGGAPDGQRRRRRRRRRGRRGGGQGAPGAGSTQGFTPGAQPQASPSPEAAAPPEADEPHDSFEDDGGPDDASDAGSEPDPHNQ